MDWILIIAAIVVAWLVFTGLLNILKTTVTTAITIAGIVLALQLLVGIGPQQLIDTILSLLRLVIETIQK